MIATTTWKRIPIRRKTHLPSDQVASGTLRRRRSCPASFIERPFFQAVFPRAAIALIFFALSFECTSFAEVPVLTRSYNNARTGANTGESVLTPERVKQGLEITQQLTVDSDDDPHLEAQPLYVPGVTMPDGKHDVVYVCTMANSIYAFDVGTGKTLWKIKRSLGMPITPKWIPAQTMPWHPKNEFSNVAPYGETDIAKPRQTEIDSWGTNDRWGILSTPVIDPKTNVMYVVAWTSADGTVERAAYFLHAIDIRTGYELRKPLEISATAAGKTGPVEFIGNRQKQRPALLLVPDAIRDQGGAVANLLFVAFGGLFEWQLTGVRPAGEPEEHGWVIAVDVDRFVEVAARATTTVGGGGSIWQGGQGPAADEEGNVYVMTSNGDWDADNNDFSETFLRLRYERPPLATAWYTPFSQGPLPELKLAGWFTPFLDKERLPDANLKDVALQPTDPIYAAKDQDLGAGGPVLPEGTGLVVGAGKDGILYMLDRNRFGEASASRKNISLPDWVTANFFTYIPSETDKYFDARDPPSKFTNKKSHHVHGAPVSWTGAKNGAMLFVWGENGTLKAWTLDATNKTIQLRAESEWIASKGSTHWDSMFGGMLSLSANGSRDGIVWATVPLKGCWMGALNEGDANKEIVEGIVYAYDASDFDKGNNPDVGTLHFLWDSRKEIRNHDPSESCGTNGKLDPRRFTYSKFTPPVIADGKVFVTTSDGRVLVYTPR